MTFLSPGFLWLAPAALVPLALHLRGRRGAPRRSFSDVALLRAAAGAWYHPDRWRHLLLLLVRTLLAAGAVLFLAGPVWRPSGGGPAGGPAWILLDASYSMGAAEVGRSVFESARARAREILDEGVQGFIQKPYVGPELLKRVRLVLDEGERLHG